jgi:hypothetical protein
MSAASLSLQLRSAIMATGLLQPVSHSDNPKHFWVLNRIVPGQESAWLDVVESLLVDFEAAAWEGAKPDLIIARRYVAKEGKLVFGWYINVVAKTLKDLEQMISMVVMHLEGAKPQLAPASRSAPVETPTPVAPTPQRQQRVLAPGQHPAARPPSPRAPGVGAITPEPPGFKHGLRVVKRTMGEDGKSAIIEEEMPLPHVYSTDMNKPNAKGKGATRSS